MDSTSPRQAAQNYLEIILNRKWWVIPIFIVGMIASLGYSFSLPAIYRSSTLIMVEPQQIPTTYITPTVTSSVQERLTTIGQQILSRTNLEKIIFQYNLYRYNTPENPKSSVSSSILQVKSFLEELFNINLSKIFSLLHLHTEKSITPLEVLVERMRQDVEVKVVGSGNAFTISYSGVDPVTTMKVTNTLASLFIEENLRLREQQASGTTEFISSQLLDAKKQLERQEQLVKEFKEKHMGSLPNQVDTNLKALDRLQLEIQTVNEALRITTDRKMSLERLSLELKNTVDPHQSISRESTHTVSPLISNLSKLKHDLSQLQLQFHDHYPDVIFLKKQIQDLEMQVQANLDQEITTPSGSIPSNPSSIVRREINQKFSSDISTINSEIESLKRRREKLVDGIKLYEKRIEDTFANEQHLTDLARDYETSQKNYQTLLDKRLGAKISENLERKQKGEQFRILDPANIPQRPYKPDRVRITLLGSLFSLGLGVGTILLKEFLSPTYRRPDDFQGSVQLPVLAVIPSQDTKASIGSPLSVQEAESLSAEQYRILYTRIERLTRGKPRTIIAMSSALNHEGKTLTTLNLALVAARDFGQRTLVIDGDLKSPAICRYLKLQPQNDLLDVILRKVDVHAAVVSFAHANLSILPNRKSVKNSSIILSSPQIQQMLGALKEQFDLILIDSPPILSLPDVNILENLVDVVVLVVRAEKTPRHAVATAVDSLVGDKLAGIILNDVRQPLSRHKRYYANQS